MLNMLFQILIWGAPLTNLKTNPSGALEQNGSTRTIAMSRRHREFWFGLGMN